VRLEQLHVCIGFHTKREQCVKRKSVQHSACAPPRCLGCSSRNNNCQTQPSYGMHHSQMCHICTSYTIQAPLIIKITQSALFYFCEAAKTEFQHVSQLALRLSTTSFRVISMAASSLTVPLAASNSWPEGKSATAIPCVMTPCGARTRLLLPPRRLLSLLDLPSRPAAIKQI